jgi:aspartate/tyrosine/aromatic aminotransferase
MGGLCLIMLTTEEIFRCLANRKEANTLHLATSHSEQVFLKPSRSEAILQKVARYRAQELAKQDVFLTEAEANYQRPQRTVTIEPPKKPEATYESLIREVDSLKPKYCDDLAEIRQTISRCRKGLTQHLVTSKNLSKQVRGLHRKSQMLEELHPARVTPRYSAAKSTGAAIVRSQLRL